MGASSALVLSCLISASLSLPQRALPNLPNAQALPGPATAKQGSAFSAGLTHQNILNHLQVSSDHDDDAGISIELENFRYGTQDTCPPGQFKHGTRCVLPKINRNIFVFGRADEPEPTPTINEKDLPAIELDYNIIFVKTKTPKPVEPVILPPNPKKTIVYVLEDQQDPNPAIIQAPETQPDDPEVYYVKVGPGENPILHGTDLDLNAAYDQALSENDQDDLDDLQPPLELTLGARRGANSNLQGRPLPIGGGPATPPASEGLNAGGLNLGAGGLNLGAGGLNLGAAGGLNSALGGLNLGAGGVNPGFLFNSDDAPDIDLSAIFANNIANGGGRSLPNINSAANANPVTPQI